MDKIILELATPLVHIFNHHAHILSILQCYPKTYPWILSNYIQLFMNKDLLKHYWGDFYFPFPYETKPSDGCLWLQTSRTRRDVIDKSKDTLMDFVWKELKSGYYLYLHINHKYLISLGNKRKQEPHDALVYGLDRTSEQIYLCDTFFGGHYTYEQIDFSEFYKAFIDCTIPAPNNFLNNMVYSYKVNDDCTYTFDIRNIERSLYNYFNSVVPEYWEIYNQDDCDNMIFGMMVYDALLEYLRKIYDNPKCVLHIYIQSFYLLMEHKKLMVYRLNFLCENQYYSLAQIEFACKVYEELFQTAKKVINLILKYEITNKTNLLIRIMDYLEEMAKMEKAALSDFFQKIGI